METIVALVDFSDATAAVVKLATDAARAFGAKLVLLHVAAAPCAAEEVGPPSADPPAGPEDPGRTAGHKLRLLARECQVLGVAATARVVCGDPPPSRPGRRVMEEASRLGPDLIVVGSRGHGPLHDLLLGGVSAAVVRKACCPVLVVPAAQRPAPPPAAGH